jgi:predicted nucleotidyltransferase
MSLDVETIVTALADKTRDNPNVHAMWLEGSVPQGFADEYSDIDIWFSVDDDKIFSVYPALEAILGKITPIDFRYQVKSKGELGHTIYHLDGMSEFLTIDINTQGISRKVSLERGIDDAEILFDKSSVVKFRSRASQPIDLEAKRHKLRMFYEQMRPNVIKSIRRGRPLEALYYYHLMLRYATKFLWLKQSLPEKADYDLKHIYRTTPKEEIAALERFYDVRMSNIETTMPKLKDWIHSL